MEGASQGSPFDGNIDVADEIESRGEIPEERPMSVKLSISVAD